MYFLSHAQEIDDVMESRILKFEYLKNEKSYWIKTKHFFLVSKVLYYKWHLKYFKQAESVLITHLKAIFSQCISIWNLKPILWAPSALR